MYKLLKKQPQSIIQCTRILSSSTLATRLGPAPSFHKIYYTNSFSKKAKPQSVSAQAHHIIPDNVVQHNLMRRPKIKSVKKNDIVDHFDSAWNGIYLPEEQTVEDPFPWHNGSHRDYDTYVSQKLDSELPAETEYDSSLLADFAEKLKMEIVSLGEKTAPIEEGQVHYRTYRYCINELPLVSSIFPAAAVSPFLSSDSETGTPDFDLFDQQAWKKAGYRVD